MALFTKESTPLTISGCIVWMVPSDTRSTNITASGGRLSAIKNLANNRSLINNTVSANQPATGTQTINGLNSIYFDNDNNRWLNTNLSVVIRYGTQTMFTVVQAKDSGYSGLVYSGDAGEQSIRLQTDNTAFNSSDGTIGLTFSGGASYYNAPAILGIVANSNNSTRLLYKNSDTAGVSGTYDGSLGCYYFGTNSPISGFARGGFKLGETIIYNKALSANEITIIVRYLARKWGTILV
jgi:hypothetical protein